MRVLFMPAPAAGHAFPLVPLAWAFRAAGHDVTFVTGGDALAVGQAGLPVVDTLPGRHPGPDPLTALVRDVDAHLTLAERLRPELVVCDSTFAVGPAVAAALGVPMVGHGLGLSRWPTELPEGIPAIDVAPPSLVEGPPPALTMRYVPYHGGGVLPEWLLRPANRPRIAVTSEPTDGARHFSHDIRRIAAATGDLEYVVTLGEEALGDLPPNVRAASPVPLNSLLRTCAAAIHHGADGPIMTCCALGVVQLAVPISPEGLANAELLQERGLAHVLDSEAQLDPAAMYRLLADDKLRLVAAEVKAEMAALPPPGDLVPQLVLEL
ncbi:MAG TPA: nucleotide disphospho-sugar-binding domain-containing protein [Actinophytocola sp.]|uniref:glycosyltransferase n=1 Tax=Actinophytocola sp. TaxID=1872138 RepID=UPI002E03E500|nr:nucleotide disphospho-sugar-binding domain-containing protein [Actinophytocola sp.]